MCNNDFPEQLAKSINSIKAKRHDDVPAKKLNPRLEKKLASFRPKPVPKKTETVNSDLPQEIPAKNTADESAKTVQLDTNLVSILNMEDSSHPQSDAGIDSNLNLFDFDGINAGGCGPNVIGNDEISYLADYFSEPAFETLYGAVTSGGDVAREQVKETHALGARVGISESRKSMIVIASSKKELDRTEKQLRGIGESSDKSVTEINNASGEVLIPGRGIKTKRKRDYFEDFTGNLKAGMVEEANNSFN